MKRSLMLALIVSLAHAPAADAGETVLQSGQRITRQVAKGRSSPPVRPALQAQTTLAQSGMRKRTKILLAVGIGVAFGGVAYAIDRGVEDSTPSSLGQR
ncbi:MAG TPA: hypothetical protein VJ691_01545 [Vicinamibacterales bacterium]|nr:hypothetical protein [Vicinamibacterales bacterium]